MSSINPNNIDGTYPIAGQDNDSQGFRDNFTNIKNNFQFAYNELADLQSKAILKSALSGTTLSNDMNYTQLISPQLLKSVETVNDLGTKTGSFTISWADGHFQYYTTSGNTTLAFSNWPTSTYYTKLRLQITTDTTNRTVTFPSAVSVGLSDIQGAVSQVVTLPTAGVYLFELTTLDNGTTITIQDLLRNYDIVTTGLTGTFTTVNATTLNVGNPLGNLSVSGTSTLSGNLVTGGAKAEQGLQVYRPTANVAVTANVNVSRVLLAPTGTIISFGAYVTLPNTTVNGTTIDISSNVATTLAPTAPWLTSIDPSGNVQLTAGSSARYFYNSTDLRWFKV
jgi:hypothetical protein